MLTRLRGAHAERELAIVARIGGRTVAVVGAGRGRDARARVAARRGRAQVDAYLTVDALIAGRAHAQVAVARVVVAGGVVQARSAGTREQLHGAVGARVAGRAGAVVGAVGQRGAVAASARRRLTGGYDLLAEGAAVAVGTRAGVGLRGGERHARGARLALVVGAQVDGDLAERAREAARAHAREVVRTVQGAEAAVEARSGGARVRDALAVLARVAGQADAREAE